QIAQERSMRNLELFVFDWLNKSLSLSELYEYAEFYQLDLSHYEQVILLQTEHSKSLDSENVKRFIRLWDEKEDALFVRWGQGKFLLLDCYRPKEQLQIKLGQFLEVNHPFL